MKSKTVFLVVLTVVVILLAVYFYSTFQPHIEQAVGKFMTLAIMLAIAFAAGWVVGRLGAKSSSEVEKTEK